jgi:hypothetical protein
MRRDVLSFTLLALAACGGTTTTDAGVTGDGGAGGGSMADAAVTLGDAGTLVGTFQFLHTVGDGTPGSGTASLVGKVYDGPSPAALIWEKKLEENDCTLLTPRVPFCATPCGGSAVCVENDVCQSYATSKPAGTVHVTGAVGTSGAVEFDMTAIANTYQPPASVTLAKPPFTDGTPVTLSASGGAAVLPFTLTSSGVAPMALTGAANTLDRAQPLTLTWTPGAAATGARIKVKLDISHHGGTKGQILCDTADDGTHTLSTTLVGRLLDLGVAGYPTVVVRRERTGSALVAQGRVDLAVGSEQERTVLIPGLTSCTGDTDCTPPQTCQPDLRCQ